MRIVLIIVALSGFVGLGLLDLFAGRPVTGIAALLLAAANGLLLTQ